jgi:hypothetical protein
MPDIYVPYRPIEWTDVKNNQIVFIDEFAHGRFPLANPQISGPFKVVDKHTRLLQNVSNRRMFTHLPDNLLVEVK